MGRNPAGSSSTSHPRRIPGHRTQQGKRHSPLDNSCKIPSASTFRLRKSLRRFRSLARSSHMFRRVHRSGLHIPVGRLHNLLHTTHNSPLDCTLHPHRRGGMPRSLLSTCCNSPLHCITHPRRRPSIRHNLRGNLYSPLRHCMFHPRNRMDRLHSPPNKSGTIHSGRIHHRHKRRCIFRNPPGMTYRFRLLSTRHCHRRVLRS